MPGAHTQEVLRLVRVDDALREAIAAADVITISAGGNDLRRAAAPVYYDPLPSNPRFAGVRLNAQQRRV